MISYVHFPDWLYEALPYGYFAVAVIVLLVFESHWGIVSGVAWVAAGATVLTMRLVCRRSGRQLKASVLTDLQGSQMLQAKPSASGAIQLVWSKAYESGNRSVDKEHQSLFKTANAVIEAFHSGRPANVIRLLDVLIEQIKQHFSTEEELLAFFQPDLVASHKLTHQRLLERAVALRQRAQIERLTANDLFGFIGHDLVLEHINGEDRRFFFRI